MTLLQEITLLSRAVATGAISVALYYALVDIAVESYIREREINAG